MPVVMKWLDYPRQATSSNLKGKEESMYQRINKKKASQYTVELKE
ncbi:hypothetical protein Nhal_3298 [Nitrosococcus halophilus Nc 4]|uniref:Uncharacterized protein n=1 Tax=Nitrosococcus halophilus (strain Nc4) TaxID=472759 RepID=D5C0L9_NITHN|nr:hypothetical protein Nhal_3298 [Nitrosococcus halophilus Nc 4]